MAESGRRPEEVERHILGCDPCGRYSRRLEAAREIFEDHHGRAEPDSRFADQILDSLPGAPLEILGQAAMRLMPATVALILVLSWLALTTPPVSANGEAPAPTDDLVTWVHDGETAER